MNLISWMKGTRHTHSDDFPGGIFPPDRKAESLVQPLDHAPLAPCYILPLNQHIGNPAVPVVSAGSRVRTGDLLADASGVISASVHAPTSGTVVGIEDRAVAHPSGLTTPCIVLETDYRDDWRDSDPWPDFRAHRHADILQRIQQAGLTGLGGASFPTAAKLASDREHVTTLIVNGAECEPYITADQSLMREHPGRIFEGIEVVDELYRFDAILVGIEDNKPDAIEAMRAAIPASLADRVAIRTFPAKYPSGGEKQLIQRLTGLEVPSGGLPGDLGLLCHNVGTLAAIADAVVRDQPLIDRVVTVTGQAIPRPGTYRVRLGTPMSFLLEYCGAQAGSLERVIMGGPMMGFALDTLDAPVVKATNCLLAPTEAELPSPEPAQPCIRCGLCEQACPVGLLPQQLMWFAQAHEWEKADGHHLFDCIECGACAYVCPSHIPLVQYYRFAKGTIRAEQAAHEQAERARQRFEARQARLEQEQAEKEARRKARAEAAKARKEKAPTAGTGPERTSDSPHDPLRARLEKAEAKLAEAPEAHRKAMETTVRKLREQLAARDREPAQSANSSNERSGS